jgi:hypothetical protein
MTIASLQPPSDKLVYCSCGKHNGTGILDLLVIRYSFASQQQNLIDNGDFDIFYISHNHDNGGNEPIYTYYLADSCNRSIWLEDLLVGKIIIDNSILMTG